MIILRNLYSGFSFNCLYDSTRLEQICIQYLLHNNSIFDDGTDLLIVYTIFLSKTIPVYKFDC